MSLEKCRPQRTLDVSHCDQLKVKPDYFEYSVKLETKGTMKDEVLKKHTTEGPKILLLKNFDAVVIESWALLTPVMGNSRQTGASFTESWVAITYARYGSTSADAITSANKDSIALGGSPVFNVVFRIVNTLPHYEKLLAVVGKAALAKAQALANAMAVKLGPALKIETVRQQEIYQQSESMHQVAPRATKYGVTAASQDSDAQTENLSTLTTTPPDITLEVTVQASYALLD